MKKGKVFHCVEYKQDIQARHAKENRKLSLEERIQRRSDWLENSDNPAARLWRQMSRKQLAETAK